MAKTPKAPKIPKTLAGIAKLAAQANITLDRSYEQTDSVFLDAPRGWVFENTETVQIAYERYPEFDEPWPLQQMYDDIVGGIYKVTDPEELARIRDEQDDPTWGE